MCPRKEMMNLNFVKNLVGLRVNPTNAFRYGHLNIISVRNKFEMIAEISKDLEIFLISKSKSDATFPNAHFKITGFKIFRYDRNRFNGGLLLHVNDKIPSKVLNKNSISSDTELIAVECHQNKRKWVSLYVSKPPNQNNSVFVEAVTAIISPI